jgi:hypothetical protein
VVSLPGYIPLPNKVKLVSATGAGCAKAPMPDANKKKDKSSIFIV